MGLRRNRPDAAAKAFLFFPGLMHGKARSYQRGLFRISPISLAFLDFLTGRHYNKFLSKQHNRRETGYECHRQNHGENRRPVQGPGLCLSRAAKSTADLSNTWDYGPLGVEFKNNVKKAWWKKFVQESPYNVGLDSAILMNPQVWVASGHVGGFSDPLMDCKDCKTRHRADKLIEDCRRASTPDGWSNAADDGISSRSTASNAPNCGSTNFTDIRQFNLMFKTFQGVTEDAKNRDLPAPGNRPGHFCQLQQRAAHHPQKAALWRGADRQILPQRDHPGQLHLPHPRVRADGAGVFLQARHRSGVVRLLEGLLP